MNISEELSEIESLLPDDKNIKDFFKKVRLEISDMAEQIQILISAGVLISQDQDQKNVLEIIINTARALTNADGGTIYILEEEYEEDPFDPGKIKDRYLSFEVLQNDTMNVFLSGDKIKLPPVPLDIDGKKNLANVSAYCANTGKIINIPDVYNAEGFDFSGPKKYDEATGYRSTSMLVIPLKDHENQINGVLQLINRKTADGKDVIAFTEHDQALVQSVSFQASSTLTTQKLLKDQVNLFNSFVQVLAEGLGEKSPYNFNHINKVAKLTTTIAESINNWDSGDYACIKFDQNQMEELSLAGWMHDIGKLTTPEHIVSKSIKLELLTDRYEMIADRFNSKIKDIEIEYLNQKINGLQNNSPESFFKESKKNKDSEIKTLIEDLNKLNSMNFGSEFLDDEKKELINSYSKKDHNQYLKKQTIKVAGHDRINKVTLLKSHQKENLISAEEEEMLLISRGTLSTNEREQINKHADRSWDWLMKLPFPKKMIKLPLFAGAHHENLNGSGYPNQLTAEQLPIQSRIIAVADVFEALTANDRPYKVPMPISKALTILGFMSKDGHLDPEIIRIFLKSGLHLKYAQESLNKDQIDDYDVDEWIEKFYPKDFQHKLPDYSDFNTEDQT